MDIFPQLKRTKICKSTVLENWNVFTLCLIEYIPVG